MSLLRYKDKLMVQEKVWQLITSWLLWCETWSHQAELTLLFMKYWGFRLWLTHWLLSWSLHAEVVAGLANNSHCSLNIYLLFCKYVVVFYCHWNSICFHKSSLVTSISFFLTFSHIHNACLTLKPTHFKLVLSALPGMLNFALDTSPLRGCVRTQAVYLLVYRNRQSLKQLAFCSKMHLQFKKLSLG